MFVYLGATEFISAAKSKGEVLLFRRGYTPQTRTKKEGDEEAPVILITSEEKKKALLTSDVGLADAGMIQKQTSIFHWEDVCYDVQIQKETRRLLDNVDGWVEPGKLTALMVRCSGHYGYPEADMGFVGCIRSGQDYSTRCLGQSCYDWCNYRIHVR